MLSSLQIENVAVIQKAEVHFEKGLNVLTGETGAGKSILIDSIHAILGNRVSRDLVRTGAPKAVIRAAFEQVPASVQDKLEQAGYERTEALLLSREITAEGKSSCRINGMPATAAVLRELCGGLINLNGQHDSVGLLNPANHEGILDDYAQNETIYQEYYSVYRALVKVKRELDAMITDESEKQRRINLLSYQVQEIEDAALSPGEDKSWRAPQSAGELHPPSGTEWHSAMHCFPVGTMSPGQWICWARLPTQWMPLPNWMENSLQGQDSCWTCIIRPRIWRQSWCPGWTGMTPMTRSWMNWSSGST